MNHSAQTANRCGVVLAAGDGKRLQPFIRRLRGDSLPKQYVNFTGSRSLLQHTFSRAEKLISPERLFTVVSQAHLDYPEPVRQLFNRAPGTVVAQPENRETAPGLLLPLAHLCKRYPEATVAVFPSDHFVADDDPLIAHVDQAFRIVERDPSYLVLLGIQPDRPETDYGYILPGQEVNDVSRAALEVLRFVEKPEAETASKIILRGGLWNTMIMVFKAKVLLGHIQRVAPRLCSFFAKIHEAVGTPRETKVTEEAYGLIEAMNFSHGVLEAFSPAREFGLLVLPVRGVVWSDWGSEERIASVVSTVDYVRRDHQGHGSLQVHRGVETPLHRKGKISERLSTIR